MSYGQCWCLSYNSSKSEVMYFGKRVTPATFAMYGNKAGYTATLVAFGWAGTVLEKFTRASGQEP